MTKKDYARIAAVLKLYGKVSDPWDQRPQIIYGLANLFARENSHFNAVQFLDAAGLPR